MRYVYIRLIRFYEKELAESDPELYGFAFFTMMMSFYIYALANIIYAYILKSEEIPSFEFMIGVFISVMAFNFYYFIMSKEWKIKIVQEMNLESAFKYSFKGYMSALFLFGGIMLWVLTMYLT